MCIVHGDREAVCLDEVVVMMEAGGWSRFIGPFALEVVDCLCHCFDSISHAPQRARTSQSTKCLHDQRCRRVTAYKAPSRPPLSSLQTIMNLESLAALSLAASAAPLAVVGLAYDLC